MQIAIVSQVIKKEDGQGRVNYELAQELISAGHKLTLVAADIGSDLLDHPAITVRRIPRTRVPTYLLRDQIFALLSTFALYKEHRRLDVIVVNGFVTWWPSDVNLVHFVHDAWLKSKSHPAREKLTLSNAYRWFYTALNARLEKIGFKQSRAVVAVSHLVRRQLQACGIKDETITVIPNGVDLQMFSPGPADRDQFGLPDGAFVALFAGDIRTSRKNLDSVLRALARTTNIHLAVAGNATRSPYPAMAQALGVADRTHFLGLRRDIAALMRSSDAFVFPSRFEPFGLVILEASAVGLPVVTARTAGACEALCGDGMIVLDSPDDDEGLAAALERLAGDPELRRSMSTSARRAAQELSWRAATSQYSRLIEGLAQ